MSKIYTSADQLIGHTPLLELTHIEKDENLSAKLLAKLEYFNPAGSVKDRIAKAMIDDAEGHLSTARDVAVMSRTILNTCPEVLHYTGIWTDTLRGGQTQLVNTNKLLRRYEGITGLKTGTTGGAGICISASATRNGLSLIAVILGAPSSADRFDAATTLLDYGFGAYEAAPLPKLEVQPLQIAVKGSAAGSVPLDYTALPGTVLVEKGTASALHTELTLPQELEAPVEQGQTVGKAAVYQGESLLEEYEVRAAADAPRMTVRDAVGLLWQSLVGAS